MIKRTFIHYHKLQQPFHNFRCGSLWALKAILKHTADILQNENLCLEKLCLKETQKGQQDCSYLFCVRLRCLFFSLKHWKCLRCWRSDSLGFQHYVLLHLCWDCAHVIVSHVFTSEVFSISFFFSLLELKIFSSYFLRMLSYET